MAASLQPSTTTLSHRPRTTHHPAEQPARDLHLARPSRDRRQDRDHVSVGDGRVEVVEEADVLLADVDVDEPPQTTVLGDPAAELAVTLIERVERFADGRAVDAGDALAARRLAQLGGDLHAD